MNAIERRLAALEQRAAVANPRPTSEPFWSAEHGGMMTNTGGLILPVVLTPEEWEAAAREQQARLTRNFQTP